MTNPPTLTMEIVEAAVGDVCTELGKHIDPQTKNNWEQGYLTALQSVRALVPFAVAQLDQHPVGLSGEKSVKLANSNPPGTSMTDIPKKLMYTKDAEQLVYLVWEIKPTPILSVICTTDDDLNRYVTSDRKSWLNGGEVYVEKVMTDHLYGYSDMRIVMGIMRNRNNE